MIEHWKTIQESTDYEISNLGRIRRSTPCGGTYVGRIRKQKSDKNGYQVVNISVAGILKTLKIHRLVAQAFCQNPKSYDQVNHLNGFKNDNRAINLEWCNQSQNMTHSFANGFHSVNAEPQIGEFNGAATLKNDEVWLIKHLLHNGIRTRTIERIFRTNKYVISDIRSKRHWNNVIYP